METVRPLICAEFSGNFLPENTLKQSVGRQFCFHGMSNDASKGETFFCVLT